MLSTRRTFTLGEKGVEPQYQLVVSAEQILHSFDNSWGINPEKEEEKKKKKKKKEIEK